MEENLTIEQKANALIGCAKIGGCKSQEDLAPCHITKKWVVEFGKKVIGNVFDNPELIKKRR